MAASCARTESVFCVVTETGMLFIFMLLFMPSLDLLTLRGMYFQW